MPHYSGSKAMYKKEAMTPSKTKKASPKKSSKKKSPGRGNRAAKGSPTKGGGGRRG